MDKKKIIEMVMASKDYTDEEKNIIRELQNSIDEWEAARNHFNNVKDGNLIDISIHKEDEAKCRYSYFLSEAKRLGLTVSIGNVLEELNYSRW